MTGVVDITGMTFNKLTVLRRVENSKSGGSRWLCRCSCDEHTEKIVSWSRLVNSVIKSCGCIRKEVCKSKHKYNTYKELKNDIIEGISSNTNEKFYFSKKHYEKVKMYYWRIDNKGYVASNERQGNGKTIWLHRMVMKNPPCEVDHKNRNKLDCTDTNLRKATRTQNSINKPVQSNNKSGVIGIFKTGENTWVVSLARNRKKIIDKIVHNFDEAVKIRLEGERKYFKEFAPQKHLFKKYGIED
jgi:hypothetical protein